MGWLCWASIVLFGTFFKDCKQKDPLKRPRPTMYQKSRCTHTCSAKISRQLSVLTFTVSQDSVNRWLMQICWLPGSWLLCLVTQEMGKFVVRNVALALPEGKVIELAARFVDCIGNQSYPPGCHCSWPYKHKTLYKDNICVLLKCQVHKNVQPQLRLIAICVFCKDLFNIGYVHSSLSQSS